MKDEEVSIALFGSFARGDSNYSSDIDIAIIPTRNLKTGRLSGLREKFEELTIPYIVDVVDFSSVSDNFKKIALQNAQWWRR